MFSVKVHSLDAKLGNDAVDKHDDGAGNSRAGAADSEEDDGGSSGDTRTVKFTSGNPRLEATRGVVHLFRSRRADSDPQDALPAGRGQHLCVLAVPNYLNLSDFCQFTGSFLPSITLMRLVRNDGVKDRYCVLLTFDSLESADAFYRHHNGRKFSSLEAEVCHILYTADVQYTESEEQASIPPIGQTELPTCPVCLERLDQHISGILTTVCNHSFHSTCISKWTDSSCPVCRYCQQQADKSTCCICATSESLWICVVCGFVGCGRYQGGHAEKHFKLTNHCYAMELETHRVWDYVGDGYVHRLIQSKSDGKVVELPAPCSCREAVGDNSQSCECSQTQMADFVEAVNLSKIEALSYEYNHLLTKQLESQREHYERELVALEQRMTLEVEQSFHLRLQKLHEKMDAKLQAKDKEAKQLEQWNQSLIENQQLWQKKLQANEELFKAQVKEKDEKITDLEEQVRDFMLYIEAQKTIAAANSEDLRDGTVLPIPVTETLTTKGRLTAKGTRNRRQR